MTNETLREQLQTIHDRHGRLDPEDVVVEASSESSPLHRYFTWDNDQAGHYYRLDQARGLIRRVKIEIVAEPEAKPIRTRYFVSVDAAGEEASRHYRPLAAVAQDPVLSERVLDEARRELSRWQAKYRHLGEAIEVLLREHLDGHDAA